MLSFFIKNIKVFALPLAFLAGAAACYFFLPKTPGKIITKTEIVEKEKIVVQWKKAEQKQEHIDKNIETTIITNPDGSTKTVIVDKSKVSSESKSEESGSSQTQKSKSTKTEKIATNQKDWRISGLAYLNPIALPSNFNMSELKYQVGLARRVIGPIWADTFITTEGNFGLGLGIEF